MQPENDPLWEEVAAHITAFGIAPTSVYALAEFDPLLPGCCHFDRPMRDGVPAALVVHKGLLDRVPTDLLADALKTHVTSFANEVFVVLTAMGEPVDAANPHAIPARDLFAAVHSAQSDTFLGGLPLAHSRMPATYMGQGRVLLETAFGQLMLVSGADTGIAPHLIREGLFDRNLTAVIAGLLRPGMTFIDIGANLGTYTLVAAQKVGRRGRVLAVEASAMLCGLIHESLAMNGYDEHCTVLHCAAGASNGEAVFHEFANRKGGSTLLSDVAATARERFGEAITSSTVPLRTLDAIVAEHAPERIDLIKIDVEGGEHDVLEGARRTLDAYRPKLILEWNNHFFKDRPQDADALYDLLVSDLRYRLHRVEPDATTRPVERSDIAQGFHDLVAEPSE